MLEPQDAIAHAEDVWSRACRRAAKRVAEEACHCVVLAARRRGKEPQPSELAVLEEVLASTAISPELRHRSAVFRARPYHENGFSRFLFSTADESDSCAQNRKAAWAYDLTEE